jgi:hypothetical protein
VNPYASSHSLGELLLAFGELTIHNVCICLREAGNSFTRISSPAIHSEDRMMSERRSVECSSTSGSVVEGNLKTSRLSGRTAVLELIASLFFYLAR